MTADRPAECDARPRNAPDPTRSRAAAPEADAGGGAGGGVVNGNGNGDPAALRAAAMLPEQLLQPGEIIVLLLKPHPLYIVLAPLLTILSMSLVTIAGVVIARSAGTYDTAQNIAVIGGVLIFARLFWQFLEWLSRVYVLTDQRIITLAGVLRVRVIEAPLNRITHSELLFSLRERFFALGTLAFYTAGSGLAEAYWVMVARPLDVHAKVVETLKRYRG